MEYEVMRFGLWRGMETGVGKVKGFKMEEAG